MLSGALQCERWGKGRWWEELGRRVPYYEVLIPALLFFMRRFIFMEIHTISFVLFMNSCFLYFGGGQFREDNALETGKMVCGDAHWYLS